MILTVADFKKAVKLSKQFDLFPVIPKGDLTVEFIESVFSYDPYSVLKILKEEIIKTLADSPDCKYDEKLSAKATEIYSRCELFHKERILNVLIDEFRNNFGSMNFTHSSYLTLRMTETVIIYYSFCIFYISRDIRHKAGLNFSITILDTLKTIKCEKSDKSYMPIKSSGKMLTLPEFTRDMSVYEKLRSMITDEVVSLE